MKHASMCCAKGRRYCCCRRERCHRAWPGRTETSSAVPSVCRYRHTGGRGARERDSIIPLIKSKFGAFHHADVRGYFFFLLLCRQMILSWTGARLEGGQYEKANVNATDNHSSTCMHYSAAAGMKICVEVRERVWRGNLSRYWRLLSVGSANRISSSKVRLTLSNQFLHQECLFCV